MKIENIEFTPRLSYIKTRKQSNKFGPMSIIYYSTKHFTVTIAINHRKDYKVVKWLKRVWKCIKTRTIIIDTDPENEGYTIYHIGKEPIGIIPGSYYDFSPTGLMFTRRHTTKFKYFHAVENARDI